MIDTRNLKVALIHEWLVGMRGAERCLECFCSLFPKADIFALFHVWGSVSGTIESHKITTSALDLLPSVEKYYRYLLPFMPFAIESFNLNGYDLVISGSSCVAKGVVVPPGVPHVSYVYSPMRYAWDLSRVYFGGEGKKEVERGEGAENENWLDSIHHAIVSAILHPLRVWDTASWMRPDVLLSVSEYVSKRLKKASGRESTVVYPPVDTTFFSKGIREAKDNYFLMITAFEPNRRADLAIDVCSKNSIPLKVVGSLGRYGNRAMSGAGKDAEFLGWVDDDMLRKLMGGALGLIVPGIEDFGMAAVEAMAAGTPVIVSREGGAREALGDAKNMNGVIFSDKSDLFTKIVNVRNGWEHNRWDRKVLSNHAFSFSKDKFRERFMKVIEEVLNCPHNGDFRDTIRRNES